MLRKQRYLTRLEIQTVCFVRDADRLHKESPTTIDFYNWGGGGGAVRFKKNKQKKKKKKKKQDPILAVKHIFGREFSVLLSYVL